MPTFKYKARDAESKNIVGKIEADNKNIVVEELRRRKLTIVSVEELKESSLFAKKVTKAKKIKGKDLVIFTRQLATMVDAGIPILQALEALQSQTGQPGFQMVVAEIQEDIQLGSSLSAGFAKHPGIFDNLYINMVKVGETGGVLNQMLDRISGYMEKNMALKQKVKSAMIYPISVICIAIAITTFLLVKVVPTFAEMYDSFGGELPAPTKMLMDLSAWLKQYVLYIFGAIGLIIFGLRRWYKTEKGAYILDSFFMKMPIMGDLIVKVAVARFSRTFATLIQSGVPILESLTIVKRSIGNKVIEGVMDSVISSVREGENIATPLEASKVFPIMVTRMIAIGETSGKIEKMLLKVAEFYETEVDTAVDGLTSIIEPLIIGFLGIVIGGIVIALFMPILTLTQNIG